MDTSYRAKARYPVDIFLDPAIKSRDDDAIKMAALFQIIPTQNLSGEIIIPGDKSISHRALILSAISDEITHISNCCLGEDVLHTLSAMQALSVSITRDHANCQVQGVGLYGLKFSKNPLNCGNSGTTIRLLCGLLSAQKFNSTLIGDDSLMRRPMLRIAEPLRLMGAQIHLSKNNTAPIEIIGNQKLQSIHYHFPIASAQVKSGILLASLYASGKTTVCEKIKTRDHTERLLSWKKKNIPIPGDISSAAFFMVAAAITPGSDILMKHVGINPTRTGVIKILKKMGVDITIFPHENNHLEPVADIRVRYRHRLQGIVIPTKWIASAIDEFPVILVAAASAMGDTILRGAQELRFKESDRIQAIADGLSVLGVRTKILTDGLIVHGSEKLKGGVVSSFGDHRIAMAFAVAGNITESPLMIDDVTCITTSFPEFIFLSKKLGMQIRLENSSFR